MDSGRNTLDFNQAFRKAADYCVIQDRCKSELQYKLRSWNIDKNFFTDIIDKLIDEGFLDERRFAINYAGGKFRMNGWGKIKIAAGLRERSVPSELIQTALAELDIEEYTEYLLSILGKKLRELGGNTAVNRQKATFFAASRGFEPSLIATQLKAIELTD